jgi:hypothetical protein
MDPGRLLPLTAIGAGIDFIHIFRTAVSAVEVLLISRGDRIHCPGEYSRWVLHVPRTLRALEGSAFGFCISAVTISVACNDISA